MYVHQKEKSAVFGSYLFIMNKMDAINIVVLWLLISLLYTFCMNNLTWKSLMAQWLEQASQWHEMYCHDLEFEPQSGHTWGA